MWHITAILFAARVSGCESANRGNTADLSRLRCIACADTGSHAKYAGLAASGVLNSPALLPRVGPIAKLVTVDAYPVRCVRPGARDANEGKGVLGELPLAAETHSSRTAPARWATSTLPIRRPIQIIASLGRKQTEHLPRTKFIRRTTKDVADLYTQILARARIGVVLRVGLYGVGVRGDLVEAVYAHLG